VAGTTGRPKLSTSFAPRTACFLALLILAFAAPILISAWIFPVLSNNPDETVYLLQEKLLTQGRLFMEPDEYSEFFQPFFFKNDGDKIFPKYTPVHAAILTIGDVLAGDVRISLGILAAANLAVIWLLGLELYGRRAGLIAAVLLVSSAWFLVHSSTYLSYTSSLFFTALFLLSFLKWHRTNRLGWALAAGLAIGIEFFARPYSAVLFAAPFAIWAGLCLMRDGARRLAGLTWMVAGALPMIGLALSYNVVVSGNPLTFPQQALEPLDFLGFGEHRTDPAAPLFDFTPATGIRATLTSLRSMAVWVPAGAVGALFVALRLYLAPLRRGELALLAVIGSVILGNVFFWGTAHLVSLRAHELFGPFYYFDLLVPYSLLLVGSIDVGSSWASRLPRLSWAGAGWRRLPVPRADVATWATVVAVVLVVLFSIFILGRKLELHYRYTERNQDLYAPIEAATSGPDESLVFLPATYIGLPFNNLANDPDLDGRVLYARDLSAENLRLMAAYPDRRYYQFVVEEFPSGSYPDPASASVEELRLERVDELDVRATVVNRYGKPFVFVYVRNGENAQTYLLDDDSRLGATYDLTWQVTPESVRLAGDFVRQVTKMPGLTPEGGVAFGARFSDILTPQSTEAVEYRYWMGVEDGEILFADPPQQWRNTSWTNREWVESEVGPAMVISLEGAVTITGEVSDE
jgi:4-amino-4-deoxy-L-arabinose transferase-like glycosyltransferase